MKKVLIISTSLRPNSNSEILAHEVEQGILDAGNEVEFITLKNKEIKFCKGCLACHKLGRCVMDDDANAITDKMKDSDVIVWATPVYYYEMAGQMKTLIDRANALFVTGKRFTEVYAITTSTDATQGISETVISGIQSWIDCFNNVEFKGCLEAVGVENPKDVLAQPELLEEAYAFGKNI